MLSVNQLKNLDLFGGFFFISLFLFIFVIFLEYFFDIFHEKVSCFKNIGLIFHDNFKKISYANSCTKVLRLWIESITK